MQEMDLVWTKARIPLLKKKKNSKFKINLMVKLRYSSLGAIC
jgi:hypothetical protein